MSWILALTQKVKFLQEFLPKPLQIAHSGHLTPPTKEKAIIERYGAALPSPMSLFGNCSCRVLLQRKFYTRRLHRMDQGRFVTQTNRFHDDRSQCFISGRYTFPFSFILLVSVCCWQTSAGSCYFYFYFSVCLSPLHLFSSTLTNYPSRVLRHGRASIPSRMSFFSNKIVPWTVFPVFLRFDIILVWSFISSLSGMFSFCSANINASSTSSSLKVPFPCLHVSHFGEVGRLPPAVGLPVLHLGGAEQLCSWLSWTYGQ